MQFVKGHTVHGDVHAFSKAMTRHIQGGRMSSYDITRQVQAWAARCDDITHGVIQRIMMPHPQGFSLADRGESDVGTAAEPLLFLDIALRRAWELNPHGLGLNAGDPVPPESGGVRQTGCYPGGLLSLGSAAGSPESRRLVRRRARSSRSLARLRLQSITSSHSMTGWRNCLMTLLHLWLPPRTLSTSWLRCLLSFRRIWRIRTTLRGRPSLMSMLLQSRVLVLHLLLPPRTDCW